MVNSPELLIKQGEIISDLSGEVDLLSLHDPINKQEQIAFKVTTTSGEQAVVVATKLGGVVNVLTHGFNPTPPNLPYIGKPWSEFRQPWYDLADKLYSVPGESSPFLLNTKTYV